MYIAVSDLSIYICVCVCMYVCLYVCLFVCLYVRMYVCMDVSMYVCIYVCLYVCMFVLYIHTNKSIYIFVCVAMNFVYWPRSFFFAPFTWKSDSKSTDRIFHWIMVLWRKYWFHISKLWKYVCIYIYIWKHKTHMLNMCTKTRWTCMCPAKSCASLGFSMMVWNAAGFRNADSKRPWQFQSSFTHNGLPRMLEYTLWDGRTQVETCSANSGFRSFPVARSMNTFGVAPGSELFNFTCSITFLIFSRWVSLLNCALGMCVSKTLSNCSNSFPDIESMVFFIRSEKFAGSTSDIKSATPHTRSRRCRRRNDRASSFCQENM